LVGGDAGRDNMAIEKIQLNIAIMAMAVLLLVLASVQIWKNGSDWLNIAAAMLSVVLIILLMIDILRR
jgi:H+/Cl- antiporter ClcA